MASEVKVLVACGSGIATSTVAQEKVKEILRDAKIPAKITKGTVGLCGSDIRNLTTDSRKGDYPFIYGHYGATSVQVQKAFELVINDKFPAEQVISKVLPLSRINDAIEFTRTGEALRVVLVPDGKESEHHGK